MVSEIFNDKLKFRRMEIDDVKFIKHLELICGLSYWSIEDYYTSLNNENYIANVAIHSEEIIGFIIARLITLEDYNVRLMASNKIAEIEICNIAVDTKFRRKGIGALLVNSCLKFENTVSKVIFQLDVRKSNLEAIGFYTNLGFVIRGVRRDFYNNPPESSFYMSLEKEL